MRKRFVIGSSIVGGVIAVWATTALASQEAEPGAAQSIASPVGLSTRPVAPAGVLPIDDAVPLVADEVAGISATGFGTIQTNYDTRSIVVFWSGDVPEELQRMVEERPHDVGIEVRAVPYSKAELDAAVAAIGQHGLLKEYEIVGVDPDVTTGLTISTSRADRFSDDQIAFLRKVTTIDALRIDYEAPPAVGYPATS